MNFNSEELKLIETERKEILNDILEELQTKSLRELFLETSEKERRVEDVEAILELENDLLNYNEEMLESRRGKEDEVYWITTVFETLERIEEIEDDYLNYIHGGEAYISGYISGYLSVINEEDDV